MWARNTEYDSYNDHILSVSTRFSAISWSRNPRVSRHFYANTIDLWSSVPSYVPGTAGGRATFCERRDVEDWLVLSNM